jgi:quercetin dioxygenase-like cupin family protein
MAGRSPIVRAAGLSTAEGPPERFVGAVRFAVVPRPSGGDANVDVAVVSFHDGARTHWHTHGEEQVLHAIEGEGFLAFEDRALSLRAGDVARIPAGVVHAHGALTGRSLTHLAVTVGGTDWPDPPRPVPPVGADELIRR